MGRRFRFPHFLQFVSPHRLKHRSDVAVILVRDTSIAFPNFPGDYLCLTAAA
jgi:hypothetical protein